MKNIHVLPTDKQSRLFKLVGDLHLHKECGIDPKRNQNIYITSDEEIKEGDWCYHPLLKGGSIIQSKFDEPNSTMKKIILTTDQDLIKDGVQSIDDEFLEWFVKNPSCEEVEVEDYGNLYNFRYLILIPKEEHKQETLEEVANEYAKNRYSPEQGFPEEDYYISFLSFRAGAKWQQEEDSKEIQDLKNRLDIVKESSAKTIELIENLQMQKERMYSEEELLAFGKSCFYKGFEKSEKDDANCFTAFREEVGSLVKQFKNK